MKLSARGAMRTRQESRRLPGFSSMWKSGDMVQVYYPIFWDKDEQAYDIKVAACWGHSVDPKEISLKRIFIPTLSEIEDGEPKVPDIAFQFSRIAPLFIKGALDKKLKDLQEKNMAESARKTAMKKVEKEYEDMSPAVGKLRLVISTECVVVPLDQDGVPKGEDARLVSQDLSDSKINALLSLLTDHKYKPENEEAEYLEVQYSFGSSGVRKEDGKVQPQGITSEYKLQNKYPEQWPRIEQQLASLPESGEIIFKRNSNFRKVEEREVISAISAYAAIESDSLDSLEEEDSIDRLKRNASIILDLKIPISKEEVLEAVEEESERRAAKEAAAEDSEDTEAPTFSSLMEEHAAEKAAARAAEEDADDDLYSQANAAGVADSDSGSTGGFDNLAAMAE